ncbi:CU044_5270 family protein [Actinoallomurus acaciae]|uniref:CU044_5270 family protein n=1 Tax=Actinoallomurus acaciae TaxID=502577 RepID=A0ABV5YI02_9ACTN
MKILDALAAARPADLEAAPDADRRYRDLDKALSQPVEDSRRRRSARVPVRRLAIGVVAVGAAAAVAVTLTGHQSGSSAPEKTPGDGKVGGQPIMLAADKAESQPLGRYWTSDTVSGQSYIVSAKTGNYAITGAATETFEWTAVKAGGGNLFYGRDLPARPQTPEDKAAWLKAGSPTSFRVWSNDHYQTYSRSAGRWEADHPQARPGGQFFFSGMGGKSKANGVTFEQLRQLSTDPDQLRQNYLQHGENPAQRMLDVSEDLMSAPVPPKLRAGIMRMVPKLPGVYSVGTVTDPLGRKGIAFAADWPTGGSLYHGYGSRTEIIFSEDGEFLGTEDVLTKPGGEYAKQRPGFVINYHVARGSAWTDKKPSPPGKLPF